VQLRKTPIILSLLATLTLLFGGWFLYQKMEVEEPVKREIGQMESAELARFHMAKDQVTIELTVTDPDVFPAEYQQLRQKLTELLKDMPVAITIHNQAPVLKEIWTNGVFVFTEAVDLHQYSRIPLIVSEWKASHGLDEASVQMDETNVYVYLKRGTDDFFTIVPRSMEKGVTAHG